MVGLAIQERGGPDCLGNNFCLTASAKIFSACPEVRTSDAPQGVECHQKNLAARYVGSTARGFVVTCVFSGFILIVDL
jgi:hypothetical protein